MDRFPFSWLHSFILQSLFHLSKTKKVGYYPTLFYLLLLKGIEQASTCARKGYSMILSKMLAVSYLFDLTTCRKRTFRVFWNPTIYQKLAHLAPLTNSLCLLMDRLTSFLGIYFSYCNLYAFSQKHKVGYYPTLRENFLPWLILCSLHYMCHLKTKRKDLCLSFFTCSLVYTNILTCR